MEKNEPDPEGITKKGHLKNLDLEQNLSHTLDQKNGNILGDKNPGQSLRTISSNDLQIEQKNRSIEIDEVNLTFKNNEEKEDSEDFDERKNYDETLQVLDELDRILSFHELGLEDISDEEPSVEDCLKELDDYLQTFDCAEDSLCPTLELISEQKNVLTNSEVRRRLSKLVARSASLGRSGSLNQKRRQNEWGTLARNHRFRATISALKNELQPAEHYDRLRNQRSLESDSNGNAENITNPRISEEFRCNPNLKFVENHNRLGNEGPLETDPNRNLLGECRSGSNWEKSSEGSCNSAENANRLGNEGLLETATNRNLLERCRAGSDLEENSEGPSGCCDLRSGEIEGLLETGSPLKESRKKEDFLSEGTKTSGEVQDNSRSLLEFPSRELGPAKNPESYTEVPTEENSAHSLRRPHSDQNSSFEKDGLCQSLPYPTFRKVLKQSSSTEPLLDTSPEFSLSQSMESQSSIGENSGNLEPLVQYPSCTTESLLRENLSNSEETSSSSAESSTELLVDRISLQAPENFSTTSESYPKSANPEKNNPPNPQIGTCESEIRPTKTQTRLTNVLRRSNSEERISAPGVLQRGTNFRATIYGDAQTNFLPNSGWDSVPGIDPNVNQNWVPHGSNSESKMDSSSSDSTGPFSGASSSPLENLEPGIDPRDNSNRVPEGSNICLNRQTSEENHTPSGSRIGVASNLEVSRETFEEPTLQGIDPTERLLKPTDLGEGAVLPDLIPHSESNRITREDPGRLEEMEPTPNGFVAKDQFQQVFSLEPKPNDSQRASSSWLRSSMRRIRHFRLPSDPSPSEVVVTPIPDVQNLQNSSESTSVQRPFSAPVRICSEVSINIVQNDRVISASANSVISEETTITNSRISRTRSGSESSRSRRARSLSSSESSLASSVDTSPDCSQNRTGEPDIGLSQRRQCDRPTQPQMPETASPLGQWPHSLSSMLATLGCTLGLFNVCRFATLSVHFGANFILQFLLLSFIFGIPLFTLQLCLGQQLGAGVIDMWKISPLFQGVGVALLMSQAMLGVYSIVGVSWIFIYFRDSFITKMDQYRWAQSYEYYREDAKPFNSTSRISETVPDYLSGIVLQRHNISTGSGFGAIKFQVAFNLAVVWMIVFVSLSKGLRSYAKVVYVFTLLPIFGTFVLCAKLLGMTPADSLHGVFPETNWSEFFLNTKSWLAASQETFLTWGLLGAAAMQLASHNKHKHLLQRDSSLIIILTLTILMLTAFLANTCIEILHFYGYNYLPDSFERMSSYIFLRAQKDPLPPNLATTPVRYMSHTSFVLGEKIWRPGMDRSTESGYQILRFATELVPATLALLGPTQISPFWAVLFYFILILFGIAQQLAIWHCVITGIMAIRAKVLKSWETTITFFSCTFGFILGLPMTTEMGIYVVYLLDMCAGGIWWIVLIYVFQIIAVFMVRGRPYSGDTVVMALFSSTSSTCALTWLAPMLSFTWNVILPVALMAICITQFRTGNYREIFYWHQKLHLDYWPVWVRQIGSMIQLLPLLCIPVVALIQSYRYLNNGPNDILERIQLLYRPPLNSEHLDSQIPQQAASASVAPVTSVNIAVEDPPPKYTPPPSYTTATGARIAKLLRQSIRRSMRRLTNALGEPSRTDTIGRTVLPPPEYSTVLVEMGNSNHTRTESRTSRELASFQGSTLTAADVASILRSSFRRSTVRNMRRTILNPENVTTTEVPGGSISNENLVDGIAPVGNELFLMTDNNENKPITNDS